MVNERNKSTKNQRVNVWKLNSTCDESKFLLVQFKYILHSHFCSPLTCLVIFVWQKFLHYSDYNVLNYMYFQ